MIAIALEQFDQRFRQIGQGSNLFAGGRVIDGYGDLIDGVYQHPVKIKNQHIFFSPFFCFGCPFYALKAAQGMQVSPLKSGISHPDLTN
jgi:hypothetical protein